MSTHRDDGDDPPHDWLDDATTAWVEDGIVSVEQAQHIRDRYDLDPLDAAVEAGERDAADDAPSRSRIVGALSLMGAALIGVGVLAALLSRWDAIPRPVRLIGLVGATVAFLAGGRELQDRRNRPIAGAALLTVGAVAVGVALFGIDDLYPLGVTVSLLLAMWGVVVLGIAHATSVRAIVPVGLAPLGAALATFVSGPPVVHLGLFALGVAGGASLLRETSWSRLVWPYRLSGIAGVLLVLLFALVGDVPIGRIAPADDLFFLIFGLVGLSGVVVSWITVMRARMPRSWAGWTSAAFVVLVVTAAAGIFVPDLLGDTVRLLLWNGFVLVVVLCTVWYAYEAASPALVNASVVVFLLQLLLFVLFSPVLNALGSSLTLILAGMLLLAAGLALERGRRELLSRM